MQIKLSTIKIFSKFETATDTTIILGEQEKQTVVFEKFSGGRINQIAKFQKPALALKYFTNLKKQLQ